MQETIENKFRECLIHIHELVVILPEKEVCATLWMLKQEIDSISKDFDQIMIEKQKYINMRGEKND